MLTCWDNEETAFENAQHWRKNTVREGERGGGGRGREGRGGGRERGRGGGGREEGEGEGERKGRGEGLEALRGIHTIRAQSDGTFSNQWDFSQWIHPISNLHASHFTRQS